jgi:hypothetical protein
VPSSQALYECRFQHLCRNSVQVPTRRHAVIGKLRGSVGRHARMCPFVRTAPPPPRLELGDETVPNVWRSVPPTLTTILNPTRSPCLFHLGTVWLLWHGYQRSVSALPWTEHPGPYLAVSSNETDDEHQGTQNVCATRKKGPNSTRIRSLLWSNHLAPCTRTSEFNSRSVRTLWGHLRIVVR